MNNGVYSMSVYLINITPSGKKNETKLS